MGDFLHLWPLADWRTPHTVADLNRIHIEFSQSSAQCVAVHTKLFGSPALIALMMRENLKDIAPFELANSICIRDTGTMHLNDKGVQFALQRLTPRWSSICDTPSL